MPIIVRTNSTKASTYYRRPEEYNRQLADRIRITTEKEVWRRQVVISSFMGVKVNFTLVVDPHRPKDLVKRNSSSSFIIRISLRFHQCQDHNSNRERHRRMLWHIQGTRIPRLRRQESAGRVLPEEEEGEMDRDQGQ